MAVFEITAEQERPNGWSYDVQVVAGDGGEMRRVTLGLSWADYNHWSPDGGDRAVAVAEAVLAFLLEHFGPETLPERFDASLARRRFRGADEAIRSRIRR